MPDPNLGFDIDAGLEETAAGMGLGGDREEHGDDQQPPVETPPTPDKLNGSVPAAPAVREPPKSWAKEKHELWGKLPPDAQDYYTEREKQFLDGLEQYKGDAGYGKSIRDVLQPFEATLKAAGISAPDAVRYLMGAHHALTHGTPEQRRAAYQKLGRDLQLIAEEGAAQVPPELKALTDRLNGIESALTERQRAEYTETLTRVSGEVEAFASDAAHPYFDECAEDIALYIKAGHNLQDAYDRAVMANPVTRAKELARIQTETAEKLKGKGQQEVAAARKAAGGNVNGAATPKAPTEPTGSMDDTLKATLREIKARPH